MYDALYHSRLYFGWFGWDALPGDDSSGVRVQFQLAFFRSSFATGAHRLTHSQNECGNTIGGHTLESKMA